MITNMYEISILVIFILMISLVYSNYKNDKYERQLTKKNSISNTVPQAINTGGLNYVRDIEFLDSVIADEWSRQSRIIEIKQYDFINDTEIDELVMLMAMNIRGRLSDYYLSTIYSYYTEKGLTEYIFDRAYERALSLGMELQSRRYRKR